MLPLILFATERSGSNLLRRIIDSHPQIASPPPSGLIANMINQRYRYLNKDYGFNPKGWVCAALALIKSHPSDWKITIDPDDLLHRMEDLSHWSLFKALNEIYAKKHSASFWFSKEPGTFHCGYEILQHMPNARFIYLVRDGRDVASSMLKGGLHANHIYQAAQLWNNDQICAFRYLSDPLMREKIFVLKYEDLLSDDKKIIKDFFDFIGIEVTDNIYSSELESDAKGRSTDSMFWKNLNKPIMKDNFGKYRKNLSHREIFIFETLANETMKTLGYKLENSGKMVFGRMEQLRIKFETKIAQYKNKHNSIINREYEIRNEFREVNKKINQSYDFKC